MSIERDRCAIEAMRLALKHIPSHCTSVSVKGNVTRTPKGQAIDYIRMTLDLYADVLDESGKPMLAASEQ
jgi:hypothetical protein